MKHSYNHIREYTSNNALYIATPIFATRLISKGKSMNTYACHLAIRIKLYYCSIILFETINAT